MIKPVHFHWDGESMVPMTRFRKLCDEQYIVGAEYTLLPHEDRSDVTHRHYFACISDAWRNLPENISEQFPTAEHLRKHALIKCGYYTEKSYVAETARNAVLIAAVATGYDEYAVIDVRENVVSIFTAKSQSRKAMDKQEFQKSKQDVLDYLAAMLSISTADLQANAGQAA